MKRILLLAFLFSAFFIQAQDKIYRAEREKVNNLVHTKLKVDFNYENSTMNGEAWVTLTPHFYPVNKVVLDAKSFKIKEVKLNNSNIPFNYSDDQITIELDKTCKKGEEYTVFIKYIAQPEEVIQRTGRVSRNNPAHPCFGR